MEAVSFTLTLQCPRHPAYPGKQRPSTNCKCCLLMFAARNAIHKALSVPREERTDTNEIIIEKLG